MRRALEVGWSLPAMKTARFPSQKSMKDFSQGCQRTSRYASMVGQPRRGQPQLSPSVGVCAGVPSMHSLRGNTTSEDEWIRWHLTKLLL